MTTTKQKVYMQVIWTKEKGLTVPDFLEIYSELLPQTVYPCFTQLCKAKKILANGTRRKLTSKRRAIVWVDAKYGGTVPVWGSSQPNYSYRNRAKIVMDLLWDNGPLSVSEMMEVAPSLKPMSTSSLVSRLVRQQWIHKTNRTRLNAINQTCCLYFLTPRGRQVVQQGPRHIESPVTLYPKPTLREDTEKTRD